MHAALGQEPVPQVSSNLRPAAAPTARDGIWPVNDAAPRLNRQALADDLLRWSTSTGTACEPQLAGRLAAVIAAIATYARSGPMQLRETGPEQALDDDRQALLARYSLWMVQLDDRLDEPGADPAALRAFTEALAAEARSGAGDGPLAEILAAFRRYGDTTHLVEALCDAMDAAVEQAARDPAVLPSPDEYLAVASRDINYRSFAHALVLLVGGTRPAAVLRAVDAALEPASRAVRLANDLRTVDRDLAAGRLNVLSLRHPNGGPVRVATVVRQIADAVRHHDQLLGAKGLSADPAIAAALRNSLHVAIGLYRAGDLR
jgi:hypothetical protein